MKWLLCIIISHFAISMAVCQVNLVPNPSFEEYSICPNINNSTDINYALFWNSPTAYTPDYFNSCDTTIQSWYGIPSNGFGYQNAHSGNAYGGLISMIETNGREYIQCELIDSLIEDKLYCVEFYVSASDSSPYIANNIGVYFSELSINSNNIFFLPYFPQISNDVIQNPINNSQSWIKVMGSFIANGGEKFITIGNFNNDINTDTSFNFNQSPLSFSYHFIDDVSVKLCDSTSGINDIDKIVIEIFPNPTTNIINIKSLENPINKLTLHDFFGSIMCEFENPIIINGIYQLDISSLTNGIYNLTIKTENKFLTKIILKTK